MLSNNELYEGFPKGQEYRQEAVKKYGEGEVATSEQNLRERGKVSFDQLKTDQKNIVQTLQSLMNQDPTSAMVQQQIVRHYANIRGFWGESLCQSKNMQEAYKGLAQLYVDDPRFTSHNGQVSANYATFFQKAMIYFAETQLG